MSNVDEKGGTAAAVATKRALHQRVHARYETPPKEMPLEAEKGALAATAAAAATTTTAANATTAARQHGRETYEATAVARHVASVDSASSSPSPTTTPDVKFMGIRALLSSVANERSQQGKPSIALKHSSSLHPPPPPPARTSSTEKTAGAACAPSASAAATGVSSSTSRTHGWEEHREVPNTNKDAPPEWAAKKVSLRPVGNSDIGKSATVRSTSSHPDRGADGLPATTKATPEQTTQGAPSEWTEKSISLRSVKQEHKPALSNSYRATIGGGDGGTVGVQKEDTQAVHRWRVQMKKRGDDSSDDKMHPIVVGDITDSPPSTQRGGTTLNSSNTRKTEEMSSSSEPTSPTAKDSPKSEYQQHKPIDFPNLKEAPEEKTALNPQWLQARSSLRSTFSPKDEEKKLPWDQRDNMSSNQLTVVQKQAFVTQAGEHHAAPPPSTLRSDENADHESPIAKSKPTGSKEMTPDHTPESPLRKQAPAKNPGTPNEENKSSSAVTEEIDGSSPPSSLIPATGAKISQSIPPSELLEEVQASKSIQNAKQNCQSHFVRSEYVPRLHPEGEKMAVDGFEVFEQDDHDDSTLSRSVLDPSMEEYVASVAAGSSESDVWKMPARNDDDGSWVNPARPLDPTRKEKVKAEVVRIFYRQHEEQRALASTHEQVRLEGQEDSPPRDDFQKRPREPNNGEGEASGSILALASFGLPMPIDEEIAWSMPTTTTTEAVYRKVETNEKDYRYTYITATSSTQEKVPANYWDKVRKSYFDDHDVPMPTDGARSTSSATSNHYLRSLSWQDPSVDVENESWMPPSRQSGSVRHRDLVLSVSSCATQFHRNEETETTTVSDKSIATFESDWKPPVETRFRRVDFTGKVTNNVEDTIRAQNDSINSDEFAWVPNPEFISSEAENMNGYDDGEHYDQMKMSRATSLPPQQVEELWDAANMPDEYDDDNENGRHSEPSSSSEETSFYTESVSTNDENCAACENESVRDEAFARDPPSEDGSFDWRKENAKASVGAISRTVSVERDEEAALPSILRTRSMSNSSTSSSPSRTSRIRFSMEPELITFQDDPNEYRGSHYARQYERSSKDRQTKSQRKERGSSHADYNDQCGYYALCGGMIMVPAVVLAVMFVFFLNPDENSDSGASGGGG